MKNFLTKDKIITFIICAVLFIGVLSIIAILSSQVMRIFEFEYESVGSIILFFLIATLISFPLNLLTRALPKALYELQKIGRINALTLYLTLDTVATSLGLMIVDHYISSISASTISITVISFLLALPGRDDFKDKQEDGSR